MVKIFSADKCPHCVKLKDGLDKLGLIYEDIDVSDSNKAEEVVYAFEAAEVEVIPIIVVDSNLLVPGRSFNTIDEAIIIIQNLLNK